MKLQGKKCISRDQREHNKTQELYSTESSRLRALRDGLHIIDKEMDARIKYGKGKLEQEDAVVFGGVYYQQN